MELGRSLGAGEKIFRGEGIFGIFQERNNRRSGKEREHATKICYFCFVGLAKIHTDECVYHRCFQHTRHVFQFYK